jgi:hypothetical protein
MSASSSFVSVLIALLRWLLSVVPASVWRVVVVVLGIHPSRLLASEVEGSKELARDLRAVERIAELPKPFPVRLVSLGPVLARTLASRLASTPFAKDALWDKAIAAVWDGFESTSLPSRTGSHWGHRLGFQGLDPGTDFRGMGLLAVRHLIAISPRAEKVVVVVPSSESDDGWLPRQRCPWLHPDAVSDMYNEAREGTNSIVPYPFATASINMTGAVLRFLARGTLNSRLVEAASNHESVLSVLDEAHSKIFSSFHTAWRKAKPSNIMAFNQVFAQVEEIFV